MILDELGWRDLIAQSTDLDALAAETRRGPMTVYAGFDPTAPQPACRAPGAPAGVAPVSARRPSPDRARGRRHRHDRRSARRRRADPQRGRHRRRMDRTDRRTAATLRRLRGFWGITHRRRRRQQPGLDAPDVGDRVPARRRQALLGQRHAGPRHRPAPPGRRRHLLHRIQLHAVAGQRLRRAAPPLRLPPADRRLRPVGQHHRRGPAGPPAAGRVGPCADGAAGDRRRRHQIRQVHRRRQPMAGSRPDHPVRLVPVLFQHRRRRRDPLPAVVHLLDGRRAERAGTGYGRTPPTTRRPAAAGARTHGAGARRGGHRGGRARQPGAVRAGRTGPPGRGHAGGGAARDVGRRAQTLVAPTGSSTCWSPAVCPRAARPRGAPSAKAASRSTTSASTTRPGHRNRPTSCTADGWCCAAANAPSPGSKSSSPVSPFEARTASAKHVRAQIFTSPCRWRDARGPLLSR